LCASLGAASPKFVSAKRPSLDIASIQAKPNTNSEFVYDPVLNPPGLPCSR
jgi:hypothetical protein